MQTWTTMKAAPNTNMVPFWKQCLKLRIRPFVFLSTLATCCVYLFIMIYFYIVEDCGGTVYTQFICNHYQRGVISGKLCSRLCEKVPLGKIKLSHCLYANVQFTVFYFWDHVNGKVVEMQLKVPKSHLEDKHDTYREPVRGTSMDQFRDMVSGLVDGKLGLGDHKQLVAFIMDVADVDSDQKVSLAEAKSIWALLQLNEFFMTLVFKDSEFIPQVYGFCGDLYAMEYVPTTYLYRKDIFWSAIMPEIHKWTFPAWEHRAKVMVGLLEFTMDAFQHQSDGNYFMCSLSEETVGYSRTYDLKLADASHILSQQELSLYLEDIKCQHDSDCQYSPVCRSRCDLHSAKCFHEVMLPTLYHVCQVMKDYLFYEIPLDVVIELKALLSRCDKLHLKSELEHSLVLNELKSLLWNKISYKRVR